MNNLPTPVFFSLASKPLFAEILKYCCLNKFRMLMPKGIKTLKKSSTYFLPGRKLKWDRKARKDRDREKKEKTRASGII